MLLTKEEAAGVDYLSIREFIAQLGTNVTPSAIHYAMKVGLVDYTLADKKKLVVLTDTTKGYRPQRHPKRAEGGDQTYQRETKRA